MRQIISFLLFYLVLSEIDWSLIEEDVAAELAKLDTKYDLDAEWQIGDDNFEWEFEDEVENDEEDAVGFDEDDEDEEEFELGVPEDAFGIHQEDAVGIDEDEEFDLGVSEDADAFGEEDAIVIDEDEESDLGVTKASYVFDQEDADFEEEADEEMLADFEVGNNAEVDPEFNEEEDVGEVDAELSLAEFDSEFDHLDEEADEEMDAEMWAELELGESELLEEEKISAELEAQYQLEMEQEIQIGEEAIMPEEEEEDLGEEFDPELEAKLWVENASEEELANPPNFFETDEGITEDMEEQLWAELEVGDDSEFALGDADFDPELYEEDVGEEFDPELEAKLWVENASEEELANPPNFLETDEGITKDMEAKLFAELALGEELEEMELGEHVDFREDASQEEFDAELEAKLWAEFASEEELANPPNFLETDEGITEDMEDQLWAELELGEVNEEMELGDERVDFREDASQGEFDAELEAKLWSEFASEEELANPPNFLETDEGITEDMEDQLWAELELGDMDEEMTAEEWAEMTLGEGADEEFDAEMEAKWWAEFASEEEVANTPNFLETNEGITEDMEADLWAELELGDMDEELDEEMDSEIELGEYEEEDVGGDFDPELEAKLWAEFASEEELANPPNFHETDEAVTKDMEAKLFAELKLADMEDEDEDEEEDEEMDALAELALGDMDDKEMDALEWAEVTLADLKEEDVADLVEWEELELGDEPKDLEEDEQVMVGRRRKHKRGAWDWCNCNTGGETLYLKSDNGERRSLRPTRRGWFQRVRFGRMTRKIHYRCGTRMNWFTRNLGGGGARSIRVNYHSANKKSCARAAGCKRCCKRIYGRSCNRPSPRNGGNRCRGRSSQRCRVRSCSSSGGAKGGWSKWSKCSKRCGTGYQTRRCKRRGRRSRCRGSSRQSCNRHRCSGQPQTSTAQYNSGRGCKPLFKNFPRHACSNKPQDSERFYSMVPGPKAVKTIVNMLGGKLGKKMGKKGWSVCYGNLSEREFHRKKKTRTMSQHGCGAQYTTGGSVSSLSFKIGKTGNKYTNNMGACTTISMCDGKPSVSLSLNDAAVDIIIMKLAALLGAPPPITKEVLKLLHSDISFGLSPNGRFRKNVRYYSDSGRDRSITFMGHMYFSMGNKFDLFTILESQLKGTHYFKRFEKFKKRLRGVFQVISHMVVMYNLNGLGMGVSQVMDCVILGRSSCRGRDPFKVMKKVLYNTSMLFQNSGKVRINLRKVYKMLPSIVVPLGKAQMMVYKGGFYFQLTNKINLGKIVRKILNKFKAGRFMPNLRLNFGFKGYLSGKGIGFKIINPGFDLKCDFHFANLKFKCKIKGKIFQILMEWVGKAAEAFKYLGKKAYETVTETGKVISAGIKTGLRKGLVMYRGLATGVSRFAGAMKEAFNKWTSWFPLFGKKGRWDWCNCHTGGQTLYLKNSRGTEHHKLRSLRKGQIQRVTWRRRTTKIQFRCGTKMNWFTSTFPKAGRIIGIDYYSESKKTCVRVASCKKCCTRVWRAKICRPCKCKGPRIGFPAGRIQWFANGNFGTNAAEAAEEAKAKAEGIELETKLGESKIEQEMALGVKFKTCSKCTNTHRACREKVSPQCKNDLNPSAEEKCAMLKCERYYIKDELCKHKYCVDDGVDKGTPCEKPYDAWIACEVDAAIKHKCDKVKDEKKKNECFVNKCKSKTNALMGCIKGLEKKYKDASESMVGMASYYLFPESMSTRAKLIPLCVIIGGLVLAFSMRQRAKAEELTLLLSDLNEEEL